MLLWRFHGADGGGRCFPSYEKIAAAARCARSSVAVAIKALEQAGLLTEIALPASAAVNATCSAGWSVCGR
jgi:Helix-turn-helix domain